MVELPKTNNLLSLSLLPSLQLLEGIDAFISDVHTSVTEGLISVIQCNVLAIKNVLRLKQSTLTETTKMDANE
jgi:hypothetical protein